MNDAVAEKTPCTIHVENADSAWMLVMQSGVRVACTVGLSVAEFLNADLKIPATLLEGVDTIILDGVPVDDLSATLIPDNARLALAAGLPGIAGLAMKQNSAVKALRSGISRTATARAAPFSGHVTVALYSLAIAMLAPHFLTRGVEVSDAQFRRYARFAPNDICRYGSHSMSAARLLEELTINHEAFFLLTARLRNSTEELL